MLVILTRTTLLAVISYAVSVFIVALTNDENQGILTQSIDNPTPTERSHQSGMITVQIKSGITMLSEYETNCYSGITFFSLTERSRTKA
jgi:hypothetical protein